jgi:hypothetical protein
MGRKAMIASMAHAGWTARRQWQALPTDRRQRLQALLRQSAGRPTRLSAAELRELWTLLGELNLGEALREGTRASSRRPSPWR